MMEEVHGRQVGFSRGCIAEGTAGTDNDGRTLLLLAKGNFTVQDVAFQSGILIPRDCLVLQISNGCVVQFAPLQFMQLTNFIIMKNTLSRKILLHFPIHLVAK